MIAEHSTVMIAGAYLLEGLFCIHECILKTLYSV